MDTTSLLNELNSAFTENGILGHNLVSTRRKEHAYGAHVQHTYTGHEILSHSFQSFYQSSLLLASSTWEQIDISTVPAPYTDLTLWHLSSFRTLRSVDILLHNGYPLDSFPRLRHLKESALFLAAIMSGVTTYNTLRGFLGFSPDHSISQTDIPAIRKNRLREEKRILDMLIREKASLSPDDIQHLRLWESLFNEEVHGALLTRVLEFHPQTKSGGRISIAPEPNDSTCAMYMNRFCEVSWMLHRTIPVIQLESARFDTDWARRWKLLDDSFRAMITDYATSGNSHGTSFITLMNSILSFDNTYCFDSDIIIN